MSTYKFEVGGSLLGVGVDDKLEQLIGWKIELSEFNEIDYFF